MADAEYDEFTLAERLCARLCHDLAGPVGAAAAGAELLEESGGDPETLALVAGSAAAIAARLKFFRAAFAPAARSQPAAVIRELADGYLKQSASPPLVLDWRLPGNELSAEAARLLLNLILLARDSLPRGGTVAVEGAFPDGRPRLVVSAEGQAVRLDEDAAAVLVDGGTASGPRGAQAVLARHLAKTAGGVLSVRSNASRLNLYVNQPEAAPDSASDG